MSFLLFSGLILNVKAGTPIARWFPISDGPVEEVKSRVTYNSQAEEYLVVMFFDRPGCDDIRAERVSKNGTMLGGKWIAAGCPAERTYPDVAYNDQFNQYLKEVSPQGEPIGREYFTGGTPSRVPALTAGPMGDFFLVFEHTVFLGSTNVYGQLWGTRVYLPLVQKTERLFYCCPPSMCKLVQSLEQISVSGEVTVIFGAVLSLMESF